MDTVSYPSWPVLEFRFRVTWNEERRRLKLGIPTSLSAATLLAEVPGGAIRRPADGKEQVHGRWLIVEGRASGKPAAVGIASSGQHGLDFKDGEIRLSVLRGSAYCHEQGFNLDKPERSRPFSPGIRTSSVCPPSWKYADIGVHEFRLLVAAGVPAQVMAMMPGLADHLAAPPAAYAHLPCNADQVTSAETLLALRPAFIRLLACKRSWDGEALVVRLHEALGKKTKANLKVTRPADKKEDASPGGMSPGQESGHGPNVHMPDSGLLAIPLDFKAFEIKTVRIENDGTWRSVSMIEED
jgi:alpha-mannosidase